MCALRLEGKSQVGIIPICVSSEGPFSLYFFWCLYFDLVTGFFQTSAQMPPRGIYSLWLR